MSEYEVPQPILNSPYEEPQEHWLIKEGETPQRISGRRSASYFYHQASTRSETDAGKGTGIQIELKLVNLVRRRVKDWRGQGYPGVTRTTLELLEYWRREGRRHRLFFAQLEAAETVIFLNEARPDLRQGIDVPLDLPGDGRPAFRRYACKMATGAGKTTVMGMLAAWSILNKVGDRSDGRFSEVVLIVCPNVTIRDRLQELDPARGEGSLYRTRDLVPAHLMPELYKGRVVVTNWHVFEPQGMQTGGVSAKVSKAGVERREVETVRIGPKTTTARGSRYLTEEEYRRQVSAGLLRVIGEEHDAGGTLSKAKVESVRYVESDARLLDRVLRDAKGKRNILVMNDEAHHAYRIRRQEPDEGEADVFGEEEDDEAFVEEATVWVEGLDRVHAKRSINFCVDLSATPYFLARVGQDTNRTFPWVVSDFGLTDAIESGLVKIPQLAVRDTTGQDVPGYLNIWKWILPRLTPAERGGSRGSVKPEAVLKWAHTPIAMLGGLWEELRREWEGRGEDRRPPVFIIVCKNTKIAKVVYEWLGEDKPPAGIPPAALAGFLNKPERKNTIRVDSKVVRETDTGEAKSDDSRWMRLTLDTVGKADWPRDPQGRALFPEGFEALAEKLGQPTHPPGRDVRCIVSVGMLTEGWDCNTVTHIVGLRPFMSQLLCEQVVGRGLRRFSYETGPDGLLTEEVAKVFGVPFEVIPFKENKGGPQPPSAERRHVHAIASKSAFAIVFPRVEGYRQAIRNRVTVDWSKIPALKLDPTRIPPEVQMKARLPSNKGRPSLCGPGALESVDLNPYRAGRRLQELVFDLASDLTRAYCGESGCEAPAHVLFPQLASICRRFLEEKVEPAAPAQTIDVFLSPYYGWAIERLLAEIRPDDAQGESPELPRYETSRGPGTTAEVEFWTSREVREVVHSHLNYVVADTKKWEQSAAYAIDTHRRVEAFVKNAGLGFAVPYLHNGQLHDYVPDFILRLEDRSKTHLILETKGYDELAEEKARAAQRWVSAVNADGRYGRWAYGMARKLEEVREVLNRAVA